MSDYKPEVNVECEADTTYGWEKIKPTAIGEYFILALNSQGNERTIPKDFKFRPIRTQEHIEREEAISDINNIIIDGIGEPTEYMQERCAAVFDKGYRLVGEKVDAPVLKREFNCARNPASNGMTLGDARWLLDNYGIYRKN